MSRRHSIFSMGLATAETLGHRLPMLWWGMVSPAAANSSEMVRMVVEKQMAFAETCVAMQIEAFKLMWQPWGAATAEGFMQAALAPSARRVKANVRRLRG